MSVLPPTVVWGTGPNSSKTHVSLALLRLLARRDVPVLPFKAVCVLEPERWRRDPGACPIPHHVAAARTTWRPELAPVVVELAGGNGPARGLLRVHGEPAGEVRLLTPDTVDGADMAPAVREHVRHAVVSALDALTATSSALVVEGAGSPVDAIDDVANVLVARHLPERRILLSTYCWNGGSAAALVGTLALLPADLRRSVIGVVQNRAMSAPAAARWARTVEERTGTPLLGTVGDLTGVANADLPISSGTLADPWADALAAGADLSWLMPMTEVEG
ncbi:hypothetical protein [Micromonospora sp. NBRC 101691]|uniref:hypothetical protein n=1 Tax=Micromonospora TaxID=1873 RepID=UPI0024A1FB3B|nr:hypothetical protein [Micromonospora sp. NBRC 101691]GLY26210.1 hypothetical protein Misp04_59410 [Micromonospora sp. NBRC 101691]